MDTPRHSDRDRIAIARLAGTAARHAIAIAGRVGYDEAAAIAELHSISTDGHLLAHGTPGSDDWRYPAVRALLLAAGADEAAMDEAEAVMAKRTAHGDLLAQLAESLDTGKGMR